MRLILMCAVLATLMLAAWGNAKDKPVNVDAKRLIGKWKATDKEGKAANTFAEFKADGKVTLTGDFNGKTYDVPGTYKLDGNKLLMKMKIGDETTDEEVTILKLTDDVLMTTEKNGKKLSFERVKAKMGDK